ncbi:hypothetical protein OAM67_01010 [bacterium]|nr:hypothetical protein [bacterium]
MGSCCGKPAVTENTHNTGEIDNTSKTEVQPKSWTVTALSTRMRVAIQQIHAAFNRTFPTNKTNNTSTNTKFQKRVRVPAEFQIVVESLQQKGQEIITALKTQTPQFPQLVDSSDSFDSSDTDSESDNDDGTNEMIANLEAIVQKLELRADIARHGRFYISRKK